MNERAKHAAPSHFFDRYVHGNREALAFDGGFRRWAHTFDEPRAAAEAFGERLLKVP